MTVVQNSANSKQKTQTNPADWSALTPLSLDPGPRERALYAAVRRIIEIGQATPGSKLPTTRDLARRLGLPRAAAVAAYEALAAEGFVAARVGAGTFVAAAVPVFAYRPENPTVIDDGAFVPLPCELGVANQDPRTMRLFRHALSRRLARPDSALFHYGDPRGSLALRQAIATYLRGARGVRCGPEDVLVTAGSMQGLDLVARAVLKPGDAAWIEDPCYPMAWRCLSGAGAALTGVPVDAEGLDPAVGEALSQDARAVYVTPSHQFPLGVTMSMRRRLALIDWARRSDAWIIEDDYDSEFRYAGSPLAALQGMDAGVAAEGRVAYLGTFAKILFPGLRIGYAVLPLPLMRRVLALREQSDRHPAMVLEGALTDLLDEGHVAAHIRRVRRRAEAGRDALVAGLAAASNRLTVVSPQQGLHLVVALPDGVDDVALAQAARENGVAARALGPMHHAAPPRPGLVLGFSGFTPQALDAAAKTLAALVENLGC